MSSSGAGGSTPRAERLVVPSQVAGLLPAHLPPRARLEIVVADEMERPVKRVEGELPPGGQLPSPRLPERRVRRDDDLSEDLVRRRAGIPQGKGDHIRRGVDAHEV